MPQYGMRKPDMDTDAPEQPMKKPMNLPGIQKLPGKMTPSMQNMFNKFSQRKGN